MRLAVALVALCALVVVARANADADDVARRYHAWRAVHGRPDGRLAVWARNNALVERHNADAAQSFRLGHNRFSDLTVREFHAAVGLTPLVAAPAGALREAPRALTSRGSSDDWWYGGGGGGHPAATEPEPEAVDWRAVPGVVSAVRDQGGCGSCWTFSALGAIEGYEALRRNRTEPLALSEQQMLDCDRGSDGVQAGCAGGNPGMAQLWTLEAGGLEAEAAYPYTARQHVQCRHVAGHGLRPSHSQVYLVREGDEGALRQAVRVQPVSVGMDASGALLQLYAGGVYRDASCSRRNLNHAMLAVGYGAAAAAAAENGTTVPTWLLRNSWGAGWGDDGFFQLPRDAGNACGVATMATFPR